MGVTLIPGCGDPEPPYGAPMETGSAEACANEVDDDGDDLVDCEDPDCADDVACSDVGAYMAPME